MTLQNPSRKGIIGGLLALSVAVGISTSLPAISADEGSLDSMWMDPGANKNAQPAAGASATDGDAAASTAPAATTRSEAHPARSNTVMMSPEPEPSSSTRVESTAAVAKSTLDVSETAAPMCSLSEFKNSALVSKGGWPGVGPFKSEDSGTDFADDHNNRVRVDLSSEKITRAEMMLAGKRLSGNQQKDLLDMQMNIDFLMEAVGIRAKKIEDLNAEIDKHKDLLLKADQTPLNLVTGRYSVNIEKRPASAGSGIDYRVVVNSLDANKKIIKEHSLSDSKPPVSTADARYTYQDTPVKENGFKPPKLATRPPLQFNDNSDSTHGTSSGSISKEQFANVIGDWQKVKRVAVKNRQTEELSSILSGKALSRQMDAIKWLVTNKKFYDMNPKSVVVDQYSEIVPAKKYAVMAQVREAYRFIDEPTGKVIKEVDDINHVNYTIERIGSKWLITDSSLLSPAKSATGKAAATPNKTH